ncbi:LOW QUALITY PROTEIN: uncharacterized protein LOC135482365 [Liolophura sinensis]|uniref:LOW QUALITY PROTEIN: uncharacterized protein LOC135482365 n=1 Tax=Liolophura sinensis TaxID=3198878 RepID=UPI00315819A7
MAHQPGGGGAGSPYVGSLSMADKLRVAASKGQEDKVQELIKAGANFEPDREGRTALHYAALNGLSEICRILVNHGSDVDSQDSWGYTALLRAVTQGHLAVADILIREGANLDRPEDMHGNAPIHEAAWNGFSKTVELLVKNNCNVFAINKAGFSALHLAAQNGHNQTARVLLYAGISPDMKNTYGDTALHTAARYGHAGVTRIIISAHCKLNEHNKNGDTALHITAALKRRKICKLLLEAGVDTSVRNKQNETAVDVAKRKDHPEIVVMVTSQQARTRHHHHTTKLKPDWMLEGPEVFPDSEHPIKEVPKQEQPKKEKRSFFFRKKKSKEKDKPAPPPTKPTLMTKLGFGYPPRQSVQGLFSQYVNKPGYQYYSDLAGNIKQGPVGYAPSCQCGPALKKLEHKMESDRDNLYEHIDASHQVLKDRIDLLDKRTTQQVYAIDKLTKERLEAEETHCRERISQQIEQERVGNTTRLNSHGETIKADLRDWVETRLHDLGKEHINQPQDDSGLYYRDIFTGATQQGGGRLFRTRSDETLSQSDYSMKNKKRNFYESRQAAMQSIRAWQVPNYRKDTSRSRDLYRPQSSRNVQGAGGGEDRERSKSSHHLPPSHMVPKPTDNRKQFQSAHDVGRNSRPVLHVIQADIHQPQEQTEYSGGHRYESGPTGYYPYKTPAIRQPIQQGPEPGRFQPSRPQTQTYHNEGAIPKQNGQHQASLSPERPSVFSRLEPSPVAYCPQRRTEGRSPSVSRAPQSPTFTYKDSNIPTHSEQQANLVQRGPTGERGQASRTASVPGPSKPPSLSIHDNYSRLHVNEGNYSSGAPWTRGVGGEHLPSRGGAMDNLGRISDSNPTGRGRPPARYDGYSQRAQGESGIGGRYEAAPPSVSHTSLVGRYSNPAGESRYDNSRVWAYPQGSEIKIVSERHPTGNIPQYKHAPPYNSTRTLHEQSTSPQKTPQSAHSFSIMAALCKSEPFLSKVHQNSQASFGQCEPVNMSSGAPDSQCRASPQDPAALTISGKDDSGSNRSNPDSGYSSRIYGNRLNFSGFQGSSPRTPTSPLDPSHFSAGTPSSSFSTDQNLSTPASTGSQRNSPSTHTSTSPDYEQQQVHRHIASHIHNWYERRLKGSTGGDGPRGDQPIPPPKYVNNNNQSLDLNTSSANDPYSNMQGSDV